MEINDLYDQALKFEKLGQDQEAINLYDQLITKAKQTLNNEESGDKSNTKEKLSLAYNNRGFLKYKKVDFDGAVEDYSTSLTVVQNSAVTYYNRGMIHYRLGRFDDAIRDMNSSLSINPDFNDAKIGLLMSERDKEEKQKKNIAERERETVAR